MSKTIEYRSIINTTLEAVWEFHSHPKAFQRLTPPPIFVQIHRNTCTSLTDGVVEFTLWIGLFPLHWIARHEPGPTETSFIDRQIKGPMALWEHQHIFQPHENGVELIDRLTLEHKSGWQGLLTRLFFDGLPLQFLFIYRHQRTKRALQSKS